MGARTFVNWYNGHPEYASNDQLHQQIETTLCGEGASSRQVVVLGQGNVALDCARILVKPVASLQTTDICSKALEASEGSTDTAQGGDVQG